MNFLMIFNMFKSTHNLPSYLFRNRMFSTQIKFFKKIFNFMGFTYRNNSWYIENINNLINYFSIERLTGYLFKLCQFILFIWLVKENINGSLIGFWASIDFIDDLISGIIYSVYFLFIFIKIKIYNLFFNKNINYIDRLNLSRDELGLDFLYDKFIKIYNFLTFDSFKDSESIKANNKVVNLSSKCNIDTNKLYLEKYFSFYKFLFKNNNFFFFNSDNNYFLKNHNFKYMNVPYNEFNIKFFFFFYNNYSSYYNFKNMKYSKWLFNYYGINSHNYSYLLSLNKKFNKLESYNLFNLNKNFNFLKLTNTYNVDTLFTNFFKNNNFESFGFFLNSNFSTIDTNKFLFNKIYTYQNIKINNIFRNYKKLNLINPMNRAFENNFFKINQIKNFKFFNNFYLYNLYNLNIYYFDNYFKIFKNKNKKILFFL